MNNMTWKVDMCYNSDSQPGGLVPQGVPVNVEAESVVTFVHHVP